MGKILKHDRIRIGLIFTGSAEWVGGIYYVHNIVRSLRVLSEEEKPYLLIMPHKTTPSEFVTTLDYPFADILRPVENSLLLRILNKLHTAITSRNRYYDRVTSKYNLQWLYPFHDFRPKLDSVNEKKISWIYDLQHKLLPELFSSEELARREKEFSLITEKSKRIVVSSYDSLQLLRRFYPETKAVVKVLQFVSVIDRKRITPFEALKKKYKVEGPYFFSLQSILAT